MLDNSQNYIELERLERKAQRLEAQEFDEEVDEALADTYREIDIICAKLCIN